MSTANDFAINELADDLSEIVNNSDLDAGDRLVACMLCAIDVLASIDDHGHRNSAFDDAEKMLRDAFKLATTAARNRAILTLIERGLKRQ
jgi:hypothetical protein